MNNNTIGTTITIMMIAPFDPLLSGIITALFSESGTILTSASRIRTSTASYKT
jgi:hypothetical protein